MGVFSSEEGVDGVGEDGVLLLPLVVADSGFFSGIFRAGCWGLFSFVTVGVVGFDRCLCLLRS